jgi:Ca-activated chloride channel homolog
MYFANPWGLLGLLAIPAILAIHFFHRRYPPLVIAGAHLWGIETEVQTMGRRWDRLPLSASLFLELLAALVLTLLLSQPRLGILGTAKHLVVVLDHSASMLAGPPNGPAFREKALEELRGRMEQLPSGSRLTVILSGRVPQTIAGPAERWETAKLRLADWRPGLPKHSFQPAWDRAAQFADTSGEMLFLTDHLPSEEEAVPSEMEVIAVGEALRNIALSTAEWTFDEGENTTKVYLRVANFGQTRVSVDVQARSPEREIFSRTVAVPPESEEPLEFEAAPGTGQLTVEIFAPADGLAIDNTISLVEPKPRPVKVSVELAEGTAARDAVFKGLEAVPGIDIVSPDEADLQIAAASSLPGSDPGLWWLGIGPLDPSESAQEQAIDLAGPYILKRRDPLVRGLELGTLVWGGVQPMMGRFTPLISSDQSTLLAKLEATFTTGYVLNIDFARSQLENSEDWPILLSNLIELRRKNLSGLDRWNYRLNESLRFRAPERPPGERGSKELKLISRTDSRTLVRGPRDFVEIDSIDQAGVYELKDGKMVLDRLAVNYFDEDESNLSSLGTGHKEAEGGEGELFRLDNPYSWLILLGLVLVLGFVVADWKTLRN